MHPLAFHPPVPMCSARVGALRCSALHASAHPRALRQKQRSAAAAAILERLRACAFVLGWLTPLYTQSFLYVPITILSPLALPPVDFAFSPLALPPALPLTLSPFPHTPSHSSMACSIVHIWHMMIYVEHHMIYIHIYIYTHKCNIQDITLHTYHIMSCHIISYHTIFYHTISGHIISYHTI